MSARTITAWVCDECGYWRQEKSTGVHQTTNPDDRRGAMVRHPLRLAVFVEVEPAEEDAKYGDWRDRGFAGP